MMFVVSELKNEKGSITFLSWNSPTAEFEILKYGFVSTMLMLMLVRVSPLPLLIKMESQAEFLKVIRKFSNKTILFVPPWSWSVPNQSFVLYPFPLMWENSLSPLTHMCWIFQDTWHIRKLISFFHATPNLVRDKLGLTDYCRSS